MIGSFFSTRARADGSGTFARKGKIVRHIPFNRPFAVGREIDYIRQAIENAHLCGDGSFTKKCQAWLEARVGCSYAQLTHSCTGALEMAAMLVDIQPGDEAIMPSFTFVSTANAFVLRGGVPVFVDICPDTLNLDASKIEAAITPRTKAIVPVHYAGVGCEMDAIMAIAQQYGLLVIEDAAQGMPELPDEEDSLSVQHWHDDDRSRVPERLALENLAILGPIGIHGKPDDVSPIENLGGDVSEGGLVHQDDYITSHFPSLCREGTGHIG